MISENKERLAHFGNRKAPNTTQLAMGQLIAQALEIRIFTRSLHE